MVTVGSQTRPPSLCSHSEIQLPVSEQLLFRRERNACPDIYRRWPPALVLSTIIETQFLHAKPVESCNWSSTFLTGSATQQCFPIAETGAYRPPLGCGQCRPENVLPAGVLDGSKLWKLWRKDAGKGTKAGILGARSLRRPGAFPKVT